MVFTKETMHSNSNLTSLFGFIDIFLYVTFFNKIHNFLTGFRHFIGFSGFWYSSSSEVRGEKKVSESNDEIIERDEVKMVMEKMGFFCSSKSDELEEFYGSKELCEVFEENEPSLEEVKLAFNVFDENKDGFIDANELQRVLVMLGLKQGSEFENCQKMIKNFDHNHDGRIDFNEFVNIMENLFC